MFDWLYNNYIEIVGACLAFLFLILEVRQKWTMWIVGIFSSAFYVYIFFDAHLYANMGINIYYTIMSFYGLYLWRFFKESDLEEERKIQQEEMRFHFISLPLAILLSITVMLLFGIVYLILLLFPESEVPAADAVVAALGIVATWMTVNKIVECWYLWILANFFAVGLYVHQGLYPTAVLYVCYGILSIVGLITWRKSVIQAR